MTAQYKVRKVSSEAVCRLQQELGIPAVVATTLVGRGYDTAEKARVFLTPSLDRDWLNPLEIPGLEAVADGLFNAIQAKKRIVVYGDFDLDGISATTVLTRGLRALGASAFPFIPHRFDEGYGITPESFKRVKLLEPDVIVTVDCGIASKHEVDAIMETGIEMYVTDHHEAADLVPEGIPVADPKLDPACKSASLAGVGVALKLVQVLGSRMGFPYLWRSYTDLATLGTVADLMPLQGENRALVADGLARINTEPRPSIAALMGVTGLAGKTISATNLSFSLVPRLNAAGRMGNAELALDLLMNDNYAECCLIAEQLEETNNQRRAIEAELSEVALAQAAETYTNQRVLVVAGENWHEGVKGIVASRLVNKFGVPSLLFSIEGEEARGSGRSVGKVNLFEAVEACSDLTTRFGGHEAAVGVTIPAKNLEAFTERLNTYLQALPEKSFHPDVVIDARVSLDDLTMNNVALIEKLAPFGQENPVPLYVARNVTLTNCRAVGQTKDHFSCALTNGRTTVSGIMFHCGDIENLMVNDAVVDVVFSVQIDEWRGRKNVKAMIQSIIPARTCGALEACLNPEAIELFDQLLGEESEEPSRDPEGNFQESPFVEPPHYDKDEAQNHEEALRRAREPWQALAHTNPDGLEEALVSAIIGNRRLHDSQRQIIDRLKAGKSTFAIMATGRGKSLTFQVYAAWRALRDGTASLFVYPLRALIADQVFHVRSSLERFGISSAVITGESTPEERASVYDRLARGALDIVLTTPEFLMFHAEEFAASRRIGFVVIDEAHHIGQAKAGQRVAYTQLGRALTLLGDPVVLALTATANDAIAHDINTTLSVEESVIDKTARENLHLDDQRGNAHRDDYLASLVAMGEKMVIYVNSREQSVALVRQLRRRLPHIASLIGFYNAGLSRVERNRIEELFRNDDLKVLVATSAFGEGVDIPNIRHVVLYHLPFSDVEFNQMSGRAGRDGRDAWVHLLYGNNDVSINERILSDATPNHDVMAQVYRQLKAMQQEVPRDFFPVELMNLAARASERFREVSPASAACGLAVFRELGLIETREVFAQGVPTLLVRVHENASKVELTDSVRYREGIDERTLFGGFCQWALRSDSNTLVIRLSHPITPQEGEAGV
jgi:single-stranded-DNA-specific exonuclease